MDYSEALKAVQAGKVADIKNLDELRSGLASLHLCYGSNHQPNIKAAIESFENEISRRTQQESAKTLQQNEMAQGQNLHRETIGEMGKLKTSVEGLKTSVDRLARPRCIDWWILIAGWIAAIAGVVVVLLSIFLRH